MKSESIVEKTLAELLAEFRATATSDSDKGTKFERLTKFYLIKDPIWSEQLANVRLREEAGIGPDVGIDLVADDIASGGKVAIQCKFYDEKTYLDDLGTFYTSSGKDGYVKRIVVTTSNQWTQNAEEALKNQQIPVQRILLHDMEQSLISWGAFDLSENYGSVPIAKKELRPHQVDALTAVMDGFKESDRGKVIMACGTGKTLVSLRIAEEFFKRKKTPSTILFLAPSISLLSQTIMEWGQNKKSPYMALAVCSDVKVGKKDDDDIQVTDLAIPASTDVGKLAAALANRGTKNLVIFSTYQSLEIISKAQKAKKDPLSEFDLVICDEAHRTTGVTTAAKAAVEDFSHFVRIHDNQYVKASKRLYMTATPKIYKDVDNKVAESGGVIASMDDPDKFGEEFYHLGFGTAVERGLLSDYRVLILAVDEEYVARVDLERFRSEDSTINLDDASKLLGCWRGLSKIKTQGEDVDDIPMKRAVAFANTIDASQVLAKRLEIVGRTANRPTEGNKGLSLQTKHVDGKQNALVRRQSLEWLKADPGPQTARILTNARCLSEGIDVPALDAVIFTEARGSQVDIVQAVGRVMRKYDGKNSGYIILPVAITAGADINSTLKGTKYKVIWDVLNALRAHDDRFDVIVNQINLNQDRDSKIEVDVITGDDVEDATTAEEFEQGILVHLPSQIADGIYAKIVEKVGERDYWEKWAKDVADIAKNHISRITHLVDGADKSLTKEFKQFLKGLKDNLNSSVTKEDAIEMLAQHLITKPVFDALFEGHAFSDTNPVSMSMNRMVSALNSSSINLEDESLEGFYESVRLRVSGINDGAAKQKVVKELYEKFFRLAFPGTSEKLGIVYTPNEIVDFMIHSVDSLLKREFGAGLSSRGVHVLDPFTGTGTFIVRLLQSGLISQSDLTHKFRSELHANELVLLAYYVAAINIEETFHSLSDSYEPFQGIVLTDTFQMTEGSDELDSLGVFPDNNERVVKQNNLDIRVVIGNPPYSIGQKSWNDSNMNMEYQGLDGRIKSTYGALSVASNKRALFDSYIRAYRWASDRLGDKGIVAFVSNGGWLDTKSADGFRKSLQQEFSKIYVMNLRGNARTQGEQRKAEGGGVFGEGSRTPVSITILVKNPESSEKGKIRYYDIGDYLTASQKLEKISGFGSLDSIEFKELVPDVFGDWLTQRSGEFERFLPLVSKDKGVPSIFRSYATGVTTNRDAWAYNFNKDTLKKSMSEMISNYNQQVQERLASTNKTDFVKSNDPKKISWSRGLNRSFEKGVIGTYSEEAIRVACYRPFQKMYLYFDSTFNEQMSKWTDFLPEPQSQNMFITVPNPTEGNSGSALMTDSVTDLNFASGGVQCFPKFVYQSSSERESQLFGEVENRISSVSPEAMKIFTSKYGSKVTEDDVFFYVFGILSAPDYVTRYLSDLKKLVPHIPLVKEFWEFSAFGKSLSELQLGYEQVEPFAFGGTESLAPSGQIKKMKLNRDGDSISVQIDGAMRLTGLPKEALDYKIFGRSPVEWVIERYQLKIDQDSGIVNDPNRYSGDPTYVLKLLGQAVTLAIDTLRLQSTLPALRPELESRED